MRTKWTLANEEVWHKTHRFGGWLLIISSIILIIVILFLKGFNCIYVVTIGELLSILIIVFYSYIIFNKVGGRIE
nr:SdpI family protein [Lacrimispora algidixylanolytica]